MRGEKKVAMCHVGRYGGHMIAAGSAARFAYHDAFVDKETKAHRDHDDEVMVHQAEAVHEGWRRHRFLHLWR